MELRRLAQSAQDGALVVVVGDAESAFQPDVMSVGTEQVGTEGVDGAALHQLRVRAESVQSRADLLGSLVGEGERADTRGRDALPLDEEANPLNQAVGLARARPRQHEGGSQFGLDGCALGIRG